MPGIKENAVSPNVDAMVTSSGRQIARVPEELWDAGFQSAEAEMLLKALRNVIIPLVRPANAEYKCDENQNAVGPNGKEFIIALEKFMTSFLRSQRGGVDSIKVELEETGADIPNGEPRASSDDDLDILNTEVQAISNDDRSAEVILQIVSDREPPLERSEAEENTGDDGLWSILPFHDEESPESIIIFFESSPSISHADRFEQRKSRFTEKALNALRGHVFNSMPIRLLCFKPDGSKLHITLVERGEIYAHIASNLKNGINFLEVSQEIIHLKTPTSKNRYRGLSSERAEQTALKDLVHKYSQYAILSHTWLRGESREITYGDWIRGDFDAQQLGYQKLVNFCRAAWKDYGVTFGWMDTICINKESSAELDESIRSMYKWYSRAQACITYLADTVVLSDMHKDAWFTRGWTLQELLAPSTIKFYNAHWNMLDESTENDKQDPIILEQIEEATTITAEELAMECMLFIPISRRMQMAAKRQVTREEDTAYSLMGVLEVSITTAYGEGASRAFSRLLQEVLNSSTHGVADIFNWAGSDNSLISHLLPSNLQSYLHRSSSPDIWAMPTEPMTLTHFGLRVTILLMPAISIENSNDWQCDPFGAFYAVANVSIIPPLLNAKMLGGRYSVLDARMSESDGWNKEKALFQLTLGVLNIGDGGKLAIEIPKRCLAIVLSPNHKSPRTVPTEAPITFTLKLRDGLDYNRSRYDIERSELERHGMKLVTVIL